MDLNSIIILIIVGAIAGWLAGLILSGRGFGLIGNIVVGIIGSFIGTFLFDLFDISIGKDIVNSIVTALVGSIVLLLLIGFIKKKKK